MSSRRTLILIAALVVGAIAAFVLFQYVGGLRDEVYRDTRLVPVFRVQTLVERGVDGQTALQTQLIGQTEIPQEFKPATAVENADEIVNKVAAFDLAPGTVVVRDMFVDQSQTTVTFRKRLKNKDHVAMSFAVDDVRSVAGYLVPGDEVNIMLNTETQLEELTPEGEETGSRGNCPAPPITEEDILQGTVPVCVSSPARMLYQKVQILAVGSLALLEPGEEQPTTEGQTRRSQNNTGMITVNVPPEAALWIASFAGSNAGLYLALVAQDYQPREVRAVPIVAEKLPGEDGNELTPYGPDGNTDS